MAAAVMVRPGTAPVTAQLTMVLLAGFPMDRTKEDLYGWVMV